MNTPLARLWGDVPVLGPIGVGVSTLSSTWQQVLGVDINRRGVIFHNPGSVNIFVAPANLASQPASEQGALLIYPGEEQRILAEEADENVNTAWMAWSLSGSNQPLSILNFTGTNNSAAPPEPLTALNQGSTIASPNASGLLVSTSSVTAISANAQRRGITFHNPGTVGIAVCPANLTAVYGAGGIIVLPGQSKNFMARPRVGIRCNCGWNAIAQSAGNNPLTVLEHLG